MLSLFLKTALWTIFCQNGPHFSIVCLLNLCPLLTLVFDYLENLFILQAVARFPERHNTAASVASLAQCGKRITLGSGFLILMILTVILLRRRF